MAWVRASEWGRRLRSHRATRSVFSLTLLVAIIYCALYLAIGDSLLPGGNAWSVLLIFGSSHLGGAIAGVIGLPPLLGMLLAGLFLRNATPGLVSGLPRSWSATFRAMALGTIFLRSGLELDLQVFKRVGPAAVRLLLLPGLAEAFTTAGVAMGVFRMPPFWALTMGFILKAVGPAVVIQTMFDLQKKGLGVDKGIPAIVVGAASFDDMVAISGYSLFSSLAMAGVHKDAGGGGGGAHGGGYRDSLAWALCHGPLDITIGIIAGLAGAAFCAATRLWDSPLKRTAVVFATALALLFGLYRFDFKGGGALAALVLGMAVNVFWERGSLFFWGLGRRSGLTRGRQPGYAAVVEHRVGLFWRVVAQPLLFGIIGSLVNLRTVEGGVILRSIAVIAVGMAVRIPITFAAVTGAGLSLRERAFVAIAWTPKATVQAALGAQPLDLIRGATPPGDPLREVGEQILTTAVFAIIICANIGVSAIHFLAPRWLNCTPPPPAAAAVSSAADGSGGGRHAAAAEPAAPAAAASAAVGSSDDVSEGSGDEGDGGGGGGKVQAGGDGKADAAATAAAAAAGVKGAMAPSAPPPLPPPLRVGPRGYNWEAESYSPTPRSLTASAGVALAAALRSEGAAAPPPPPSRRGDLWCRCPDGGCPDDAGGGGDLATASRPRRGELPPLPPSAPAAAAKGAGATPEAEAKAAALATPVRRKDSPGGGGGGGGEKGTPQYATPQPRLRRCLRCRGLLPPPPAAEPSPLHTQPRPVRRHSARGSPGGGGSGAVSPFTGGGGRDGAGDGSGSGDETGGGGAARRALELTPTRSHSAPVDALPPLPPVQPSAPPLAAAAAPRPPAAGGAAGAAALQRQLAALEADAAAVARLAESLAATGTSAAGAAPSGGDDSAAAAAASEASGGGGSGARELARRVAALQAAAGAIRRRAAAAAAAASGGDEGSGEEMDAGGAASDEEPAPETARAFFRRAGSLEGGPLQGPAGAAAVGADGGGGGEGGDEETGAARAGSSGASGGGGGALAAAGSGRASPTVAP
ncbi:hypothetical protein HYH03_017120 [Edaphochlamys debaryana]|uniref:Cation/H+ exchanger transmembrane domain-containing protein n=1 Tax=Edaphochlamys debaryana TaxID=47281 RepID=A0A836BPF4_9CHLO|nr:hypothetical protein HYH03_017120 [Edaphochlamys debaryana]|eukprot:KAG2484030.1 hypothetical protein HYH03_017120 [Edaphochlamys debaryana]